MRENAEGRDSHERHEPYAWHEPTRPEQHHHTPTHAGNGTVNDSPETKGPDPEGEAPAQSPEKISAESPAPPAPPAAEPPADTPGTARASDTAPPSGTAGAPDVAGAAETARAAAPAANPRTPSARTPAALSGTASVTDPEAAPGTASAADPAGDGEAPGGLGPDELALRRLLHRAVEDVEPSEGTLEHLRRAVPARRARKRQAAVGMAAAALFLGTAVPALVHVSHATGSDADPAIAGQASQAQGGTGQGKAAGGASSIAGGSPDRPAGKETGGTKDGAKGSRAPAPGTAPAGTPQAPSASARSAPVCTAGQLGSATATVSAPDSAGAVYGTFHVTNVSPGSCTVGGPGTVTTLTQGVADASRVSVVQHTAGDAAAGLPDPSTESAALVLSPGSGYEVKFAWVPSDACPTSGGGSGTGGTGGTETGNPTPGPSPSQETTAASGPAAGSDSGTGTGTTTQLVTEDGGRADGSVVVSHTPEAGSPTVSATVPDACAGTVYRTGLLATAP